MTKFKEYEIKEKERIKTMSDEDVFENLISAFSACGCCNTSADEDKWEDLEREIYEEEARKRFLKSP